MHDTIRPIRRALLSVSDKAGIAGFARALHERGGELVSTGGTARVLREAGLPVREASELTGFPEMLDGRVKTLHPAIHGGILAVEEDPGHAKALEEHGIGPIDLVCIDLYPFERTIARPDATRPQAVEQIDIGGPAMVRSAAKNHDRVAVVTSPAQYDAVLADLHRHGGTSRALRESLAAAAFARTSAYDAAIARYLGASPEPAAQLPPQSQFPPGHPPQTLAIGYQRVGELRYGENPHQAAAAYKDPAYSGPSVVGVAPLHGKALSYNNLADAAAALELALDLSGLGAGGGGGVGVGVVGAAVVKHANPCGAARAGSADHALDLALAGDPVAAFGGIVACSHAIDAAAAERLSARDLFLEVIVAPAFEPAALDRLRARWSTTRLLAVGHNPRPVVPPLTFRSLPGGALAQAADTARPDPASWTLAAGPNPDPATLAAAAALVAITRALTSNAVAIGGVTGGVGGDKGHRGGAGGGRGGGGVALFGAGAGQMDRLTSCRLAVLKAGERARGSVAASDGFFPFADGPGVLIDAGVATIVQPGGSKRDRETIERCQAAGVTLLLTGTRHFRH